MTIKYIIPIGANNGTNKTFVKFIDKIIKQKGLDIFISDEIVIPELDVVEKVVEKIKEILNVIPEEECYFLVFNKEVVKKLSQTPSPVKNINEILQFINSVPQDISGVLKIVVPYIDDYLQTHLSSSKRQQK